MRRYTQRSRAISISPKNVCLNTLGVRMALARFAKGWLRRNVPLTCAAYIANDWWSGVHLSRGDKDTLSGTYSSGMLVDEAADYVERTFRSYLEHSGRTRFRGTVAELGPGDTLGVGIMCRANGADEYHAVDRYLPRFDPTHRLAVHRAVASKAARPDLLDESLESGVVGVVHHHGTPAETFFRNHENFFDAILSCAVLEHTYDPLGALDDMLTALRPGGVMVHIVDHRDHGMFAGNHPLTFLTIPDSVYSRMVRNSGRPNRVMYDDYRRWLGGKAISGHLLVTWLVGRENREGVILRPPCLLSDVAEGLLDHARAEVRSIRSRICSRFATSSEDHLAVAGSVLVAHKPK
jgi:SAM-dependent methyltransferase